MASNMNVNSVTPELKRQNAMTIINAPDFETVLDTELEKEIYALIERFLEAEARKDINRDTVIEKEIYAVIERLLEAEDRKALEKANPNK